MVPTVVLRKGFDLLLMAKVRIYIAKDKLLDIHNIHMNTKCLLHTDEWVAVDFEPAYICKLRYSQVLSFAFPSYVIRVSVDISQTLRLALVYQVCLLFIL